MGISLKRSCITGESEIAYLCCISLKHIYIVYLCVVLLSFVVWVLGRFLVVWGVSLFDFWLFWKLFRNPF